MYTTAITIEINIKQYGIENSKIHSSNRILRLNK